VLKQDNADRITTPLTQDSIHEHLRKHGDGVKVALWVEDASATKTMKRGARSFMEPTVEKDEW
jgi:4-hydroxyphenylpyruvate dioxygenase